MNRRKLFSLLAPFGFIFLWPRNSEAQKIKKYNYLVPGKYSQKTIQEHLSSISKRIQDLEGGL